MPNFIDVNASELELIAFAEPQSASATRRRLVSMLYSSGKLRTLLEATKILRHGKKLYAFENFFLLKAVTLELNDYHFEAIIIDEKRKDNLIQRIINQAVADSAGSCELGLLPSFDKNNQKSFSAEEVMQREVWAIVFDCHRSAFYYQDKSLKSWSQNQNTNSRPEFDKAVLGSIPKRKK